MKSFKMLALTLSVLSIVCLTSCGKNNSQTPSENTVSDFSSAASQIPSDIDLTGSSAGSAVTSQNSAGWNEPQTSGNNQPLTEEEQSKLKEKLINEINSLIENQD